MQTPPLSGLCAVPTPFLLLLLLTLPPFVLPTTICNDDEYPCPATGTCVAQSAVLANPGNVTLCPEGCGPSSSSRPLVACDLTAPGLCLPLANCDRFFYWIRSVWQLPSTLDTLWDDYLANSITLLHRNLSFVGDVHTMKVHYLGREVFLLKQKRALLSTLNANATRILILEVSPSDAQSNMATIHSLNILISSQCRNDPLKLLNESCTTFIPLGCDLPVENSPYLQKDKRRRAEGGVGYTLGDICIASCAHCPSYVPTYAQGACPEGYVHSKWGRGCPAAQNWFRSQYGSSPLYNERFCPKAKEEIEFACTGKHADYTIQCDDPTRCDKRGYLPLRVDEATETKMCVDRFNGELRVGTNVSSGTPLLCHIPEVVRSTPACLPGQSSRVEGPSFQPICRHSDQLYALSPYYRIIEEYSVVYDIAMDGAEADALKEHLFRNELLPTEFCVIEVTSQGSSVQVAVRSTAEAVKGEVTKLSGVRDAKHIASRTSLVKYVDTVATVRKERSLALDKQFRVFFAEQEFVQRFGVVGNGVTATHPRLESYGGREQHSFLRATFPNNGGWVEFTGPAVQTTEGEAVHVTMISSTLETSLTNRFHQGRATWGIYSASSAAACPIPDDDVYDPFGLGNVDACSTVTDDTVAQELCRVGDLTARHGRLRAVNPKWRGMRDFALPTAGWASIEGRIIVLGTDPPVCATIKKGVRPKVGDDWEVDTPASTTLTTSFAKSNQFPFDGYISFAQSALAADTLISVHFSGDSVMNEVSYRISHKENCDFHADDVYAPYASIDAERVEAKVCAGIHPSVSPVEAGCALGDLDAVLSAHRGLPTHGTAIHSYLEVSAEGSPSLLSEAGGQKGLSVVILKDGAPIACAPLLQEKVGAKGGEGEKETEKKKEEEELLLLLAVVGGVCCLSIGTAIVWIRSPCQEDDPGRSTQEGAPHSKPNTGRNTPTAKGRADRLPRETVDVEDMSTVHSEESCRDTLPDTEGCDDLTSLDEGANTHKRDVPNPLRCDDVCTPCHTHDITVEVDAEDMSTVHSEASSRDTPPNTEGCDNCLSTEHTG